MLRESPVDPPLDCKGIVRLCAEVEELTDRLSLDRSSLPSKSVLDGFHRRARAIVSTLSKEECRYLLQIWLVSLTVCDLSFYLSFQATSEKATPFLLSKNELSQTARSGVYQVNILQSESQPGCLIDISSDPYALRYELKVIDFDQKPARKLRTRSAKEAILDGTVTN